MLRLPPQPFQSQLAEPFGSVLQKDTQFNDLLRHHYHSFERICSPTPFDMVAAGNVRVRAVWQTAASTLGQTNSALLEFAGSAMQYAVSKAIFDQLYRVHKHNASTNRRCEGRVEQLQQSCSTQIKKLLSNVEQQTPLPSALRATVQNAIDGIVGKQFEVSAAKLTALIGSVPGTIGTHLQVQHDEVFALAAKSLGWPGSQSSIDGFHRDCTARVTGMRKDAADETEAITKDLEQWCKKHAIQEFDAITQREIKPKFTINMSPENANTGFDTFIRQRAHVLAQACADGDARPRVTPKWAEPDAAAQTVLVECEGSREQITRLMLLVGRLDAMQREYEDQRKRFIRRLNKFKYDFNKKFTERLKVTVDDKDLKRYSKSLVAALQESSSAKLKVERDEGTEVFEAFHTGQMSAALEAPVPAQGSQFDPGPYRAKCNEMSKQAIGELTKQLLQSKRAQKFGAELFLKSVADEIESVAGHLGMKRDEVRTELTSMCLPVGSMHVM